MYQITDKQFERLESLQDSCVIQARLYFRKDYVGRWMKDPCLGVVVDHEDDIDQVVEILSQIIADRQDPKGDHHDVLERVSAIMRRDDMGMGTIYYWPGIKVS